MTLFSLGKNAICQLAQKKKGGWSVIVSGDLVKGVPRLVHGFRIRHDAIEYALQVHELTREQYGDNR